MNETIMNFISNLTDVDPKFIDMDLSFDELHMDIEDIKELLITIEDELDIDNATSIMDNITVDDSLSTLIKYIEDLQ